MTSNGSTLTKCPSKNAGLLPSEIFKDSLILTYKGYPSSSIISKAAVKRGPHCYLNVDRIVITRSLLVIQQ